jgi:hypothetical protein
MVKLLSVLHVGRFFVRGAAVSLLRALNALTLSEAAAGLIDAPMP